MIFIQITAQLDLQLSYGFCNCLGNEKRQDAINIKDSTLNVVIETIFLLHIQQRVHYICAEEPQNHFTFQAKMEGSHPFNRTGA